MRIRYTAYLLLISFHLFSQSNPVILGMPDYHMLDRLEIKTGQNLFYHSSLKPYTRIDLMRFAKAVDQSKNILSIIDQDDLKYLFRANNEWLGEDYLSDTIAPVFSSMIEKSLADERYELSKKKVFNYFYPTPANLIEVNERAFHLRVNPIINLQTFPEQEGELLFINQRGTDLRGGIDDKFFFHTQIIDNQGKFPQYVEQFVEDFDALPGVGFLKDNRNTSFGLSGGYDYLISNGLLGFNVSDHVGLQLGYGQNFIGNGYRSLLLSNFSYNYFFLKINWKVWKLHFQNIFTELSSRSSRSRGNQLLPKKYMAAHHLTLRLTPNFSVGLFEAVVFNRENQFEFQYLLPIIFYRAVEQGLGSPDNVLLGLDLKWNLWNKVQLYGQFVLDELVFNEAVSNNRGWWGNKFGLQTGLKYIDLFGIDHLDIQVERNTVRPYTYSHNTGAASYSHYNQPLAHPLGANFREWIFMGKYRPHPRIELEGRFIRSTVGEDADSLNWGGNILLPNIEREQNYDNETAQGFKATINMIGLDLSYRLSHNVFLDLQYFRRTKRGDLEAQTQNTQYFGGGIRINIQRLRMDF